MKLNGVEGQVAVALSQDKAAREQADRLKRVVEGLRHTEERYRLLAQSTNDAIWDYDYATDRLEYNARFIEFYGDIPAHGIGGIAAMAWHIHPEEREQATQDKAEIARFLSE